MGKMSVITDPVVGGHVGAAVVAFFFPVVPAGIRVVRANLWIASAIVIAGIVWALLAGAAVANDLGTREMAGNCEWRAVGLFFIPSVFGEFINCRLSNACGNIISLGALMKNVTKGLFGTFERVSGTMHITEIRRQRDPGSTLIEPPLWASWTVLFLICAVCLALLHGK